MRNKELRVSSRAFAVNTYAAGVNNMPEGRLFCLYFVILEL
jgi:hypothetical protein